MESKTSSLTTSCYFMMTMHLIISFLLHIITAPFTDAILVGGKEGVECYDCNYSPSGDVRGKYGWISSDQAGYPKCALATKDDTYRVDKISCSSGTCFIRMDQNGLLYRGCADYSYLPWTVDVRLQCRYQGPFYSLWWFCNSSLCNDGLIDSKERCAYNSPDSLQVLEREKLPINGLPFTNAELSSKDGRGKELVTGESEVEVSNHRTEQESTVQPEGPAGLESADTENQQENNEQDERREKERNREIEGARDIKENPCDGTCRENTSGLFAHPYSRSYFIHCGHGNVNGQRCFCCQPFVVMCPPNTVFDNTYKICRRLPY